MTREQFVQHFRWEKVMWVMGILNVVALTLQPIRIAVTHEVAGVSIWMFIMFFFIQAAFAIEFFLKKSWGGMTSMALATMVSLTTIGMVIYFG